MMLWCCKTARGRRTAAIAALLPIHFTASERKSPAFSDCANNASGKISRYATSPHAVPPHGSANASLWPCSSDGGKKICAMQRCRKKKKPVCGRAGLRKSWRRNVGEFWRLWRGVSVHHEGQHDGDDGERKNRQTDFGVDFQHDLAPVQCHSRAQQPQQGLKRTSAADRKP